MKNISAYILLVIAASLCFATSVMAASTIPMNIVNGSFETGDLSGWLTSVPGNIDNVGVVNSPAGLSTAPAAAQDGSYWAAMNALGTQVPTTPINGFIFQQNLDLAAYAATIDAGDAYVSLSGWGYGETGGTPDYGQVGVSFYDGGGGYISTAYSNQTTSTRVWEALNLNMASVPVGTRILNVGFAGHKFDTNSFDVGFDNISGSITIPLPAPLFAGMAMLGGMGLIRKLRRR